MSEMKDALKKLGWDSKLIDFVVSEDSRGPFIVEPIQNLHVSHIDHSELTCIRNTVNSSQSVEYHS